MYKKYYLFGLLTTLLIILSCVLFFGGARFNEKVSNDILDSNKAQVAFIEAKEKEEVEINKKNVYEKLTDGNDVNFLIVGDSIGAGTGASDDKNKWYNLLSDNLENKYDSFINIHRITKGGSDTFDGIVEFKNAFPDDSVDMVFVSFGQNDQGLLNGDSEKFGLIYESLIRNIIKQYPKAEIGTIIESSLSDDSFAEEIETVSKHYNLVALDSRIPFNDSKIDYKKLATDGIHPSDKGHELYANYFSDLINDNISGKRTFKNRTEIKALDKDVNKYSNIQQISEIKNADGFENKGSFYVSNKTKSSLKGEFSGGILGLTLSTNTDGGQADVYIDGEFVKSIDVYNPSEVERHFFISDNFSKGEHTFEVVIKSSHNKKSTGDYVRLKNLITN